MLTAQRFNRLLHAVSEDPWRTLAAMGDSLLRDWEATFPGQFSQHADIWASKDGLILELPVPGRSPDDFEVAVEGRRLDVNAKPPAASDGETRQLRSERVHGEFSFAWTLPFEPDAQATKVNYQDGILRVEVRQSPAAARRTLAVNAQ